MANDAAIWFPYHIKDFRSETYKMTHAEKGIYLTLVESIWEADGAIPCDDKWLAAELGIRVQEWSKLKPRILRHFTIGEKLMRHDRIDGELLKAKANIDQKRRAGIASAIARGGNGRSTGVQRAFNGRTNGEATEGATERQRGGNGEATAGQPYAGGGGGGGEGPSHPRNDLLEGDTCAREDAPFKVVS